MTWARLEWCSRCSAIQPRPTSQRRCERWRVGRCRGAPKGPTTGRDGLIRGDDLEHLAGQHEWLITSWSRSAGTRQSSTWLPSQHTSAVPGPCTNAAWPFVAIAGPGVGTIVPTGHARDRQGASAGIVVRQDKLAAAALDGGERRHRHGPVDRQSLEHHPPATAQTNAGGNAVTDDGRASGLDHGIGDVVEQPVLAALGDPPYVVTAWGNDQPPAPGSKPERRLGEGVGDAGVARPAAEIGQGDPTTRRVRHLQSRWAGLRQGPSLRIGGPWLHLMGLQRPGCRPGRMSQGSGEQRGHAILQILPEQPGLVAGHATRCQGDAGLMRGQAVTSEQTGAGHPFAPLGSLHA